MVEVGWLSSMGIRVLLEQSLKPENACNFFDGSASIFGLRAPFAGDLFFLFLIVFVLLQLIRQQIDCFVGLGQLDIELLYSFDMFGARSTRKGWNLVRQLQ